MKNRLFLTVSILLLSVGLFAFEPGQVTEKPIFIEGFEEYNTTYQLNKAFTVWNDGANLKVFLDTDTVKEGGYSFRVDVLGPNPYDGQKSGSIYHSLPFLSRNWTNAAGIAFWVKNPSADPLWLTFNFKEAYNEYWSVTPGAPYMVQAEDGTYTQMDCLYGNLVVPPDFTGSVIIPVGSLTVPDWNTARGDKVLQLGNIESFAIGVTLDEDYPRTFYIDSFEVLSSTSIPPVIRGPGIIQIPASGEHREKYSLTAPSVETNEKPVWKVISRINPMISIDQSGMLAVPAGGVDETISIVAETLGDTGLPSIHLSVKLLKNAAGVSAASEGIEVQDSKEDILQKTDYDRFAENFEKWAMENRPLFVLLSVTGVVLVIFILSTFQNKLK